MIRYKLDLANMTDGERIALVDELIVMPIGSQCERLRELGIDIVAEEDATRMLEGRDTDSECDICVFAETLEGEEICTFYDIDYFPCDEAERDDEKEVVFVRKMRWKND